jgi:hypothetical protein
MIDHVRHPLDPETQRIRFLTMVLGVLSFIAIFVWGLLVTMARDLSGMGDGSASIRVTSIRDNIFVYSGSLYLFLVFISCFWFVRRGVLKTIGIVAHLILGVFALQVCEEAGTAALVLLAPFAAFDAGWFWLFSTKNAPDNAQRSAEG